MPAASAVKALVARDVNRVLKGIPKSAHNNRNHNRGNGTVVAPAAVTSQLRSHMKIVGKGRTKSGHDTVTYAGRDVVAMLGCNGAGSVSSNTSTNVAFVEEITPSNSLLFPRLSAAALMFERFRSKRLRLSYVPTCATSTGGAVVLGIQTDPGKAIPGDVVKALQLEHSVSSAPWVEMCTPDMKDDRELFLSSQAVEVGMARNFGDGADLVNSSQQRLTSNGHAFVLMNGIGISSNVGYLLIDYEIELINPIAPPSVTFSGAALTNQTFSASATPGSSYSPLLSLAAIAQLGYWAYNLYNAQAPGSVTTTATGPITSYNSLLVEAAQYLISYYIGLDAATTLEEKKSSERDYQVVVRRPTSQSWRHPRLRRKRHFTPLFDEIVSEEPPKPLAAGDISVQIYLVTDSSTAGTEESTLLYTKVFSGGSGAQTISDSLPMDLTNFLSGPFSGTLGFDGDYSGKLCLLIDPSTSGEMRQITTPGQWDGTFFNVVELPEQQNANN